MSLPCVPLSDLTLTAELLSVKVPPFWMLSWPVAWTVNVPPLAVTVALLTVMLAELKSLAPMVIAPVWVSDAPVLTLRFPWAVPVIPTLSAPPVVALAELARVRLPVAPPPTPTLTPVGTVSVVPEPVIVADAFALVAMFSVGADMSLPRLTVALALLTVTVLPLVQLTGLVAARLKLPAVTFNVPVLLKVTPAKVLAKVTVLVLPPIETPATLTLPVKLTL
jgi:hypothetical protein